jgi:hypothetical protein
LFVTLRPVDPRYINHAARFSAWSVLPPVLARKTIKKQH